MSKRKHAHSQRKAPSSEPLAAAAPAHDVTVAGFGGPGYSGFAGSAGYSGSGAGGISGGYAGAGYIDDSSWAPPAETRHDDRIHDDVCARLAMSGEIDASEIEVLVQAGSVTLQGEVETRHMKHIARDIAEAVHGVSSVHNHLHVEQSVLEELKEKLAL